MEKTKWWIVVFLATAAACFLAFSLYKKRVAVVLPNKKSGSFYNLVRLSPAELDSLKMANEYLYLLHRGVYFSKTKQTDSAAAVFRRMINLKPGVAFAYCELGKVFVEAKQYDSSLFYLGKAGSIKPNYLQVAHFKNIAEKRKNGEEDYD